MERHTALTWGACKQCPPKAATKRKLSVGGKSPARLSKEPRLEDEQRKLQAWETQQSSDGPLVSGRKVTGRDGPRDSPSSEAAVDGAGKKNWKHLRRRRNGMNSIMLTSS